MKRLAFWIAAAALLVSAPRLALAFLLADGVLLEPAVEASVYAWTGVASGLVLTGGNVYLAHALAQHYKRRGGLWWVLLGAWVLFLAFSIVLIAPALVAGLTHSVLAEVLTAPQQRWLWAVVAALSVEVLAAAAMAAHVLSAEPTQASTRSTARSGVSSAMSDAAVRLLGKVAAEPASAQQPAATLSAAASESTPVDGVLLPPVSTRSVTLSIAPTSAQPAPPCAEVASTEVGRYPCRSAGCPRSFVTPQARSAHEGRAHKPLASVAGGVL